MSCSFQHVIALCFCVSLLHSHYPSPSSSHHRCETRLRHIPASTSTDLHLSKARCCPDMVDLDCVRGPYKRANNRMLSAHQSIYDLPNGNGPPYPLRPDSVAKADT
ncbi:hypothetical protein FA13DRAFT_97130 [Coprinellus micaceus]|uniref:Uncharacterized protein n=1 Tax=Coprinellus micaceus TaxID=71717 RepID=A0A4Y7SIE6_COPMI|nr:hypothetical protein FA13DRAFT_97130 [Coprinellus micaceus]